MNAGGIQTTRQWIADNEQIALIARGGKKRLSRHALTEIVAKAKHWHEPEAA